MAFKDFNALLQKHFADMATGAKKLFEVEVDKEELWNLYLDSFPAGTNEIYRERREYDCCCCRQFIKRIGNAVAIKEGKLVTIWDFDAQDSTYQPVIDALAAYIRSKAVTDVYVNPEKTVGTAESYEKLDDGTVQTWDHFCVKLPDNVRERSSRSEGEVRGAYRDLRNVFKRALDEITLDSAETVLELIAQGSLYRGEEQKYAVETFAAYKKEYAALNSKYEKELYAWEKSLDISESVGKIRNTSVGTLLVDLSEDKELDDALKSYEKIMAPANYKRPNAIFTPRMLEAAKKTVEELGYTDALARRYANLDDITVNNILFSNRDAAKRIEGADVFSELSKGIASDPRKFSRVEEISVEDFIKNVLPTARELEVFLEGKHMGNMCSIIAPKNRDSKTMFKWNNNFGWAYSGNMTDSMLKERVKAAGGNVEGELRFSIQWNDIERDGNDLDAHCMEPNRNMIFFENKGRVHASSGMLDVDIQHPDGNIPAVENITWSNRDRMPEGTYKMFVRNFHHRGGRKGFRAEIEFDGQIHSFEHDKELKHKEDVQVAEVIYSHKDGFKLIEKLTSSLSSREIWGLNTNQFVPVSVVMYSPNYWDEQDGIGNRHYMFMLKDCVNPEKPNGFYNEFLKNELMAHKRVFEALGSKLAVEFTEDQLSGLGFSSTVRNELIVKVKGQTERVLRIKF